MYCGSIEECLSEVMQGKADGTIINTLRTELVTGNTKYKGLSCVQLKGDDSRCFGVNEDNTELILILNRGLRILAHPLEWKVHTNIWRNSIFQTLAISF